MCDPAYVEQIEYDPRQIGDDEDSDHRKQDNGQLDLLRLLLVRGLLGDGRSGSSLPVLVNGPVDAGVQKHKYCQRNHTWGKSHKF